MIEKENFKIYSGTAKKNSAELIRYKVGRKGIGMVAGQ